MNNKIHYTYIHCTKDDLKKEVSFSEDDFSDKLQKLFEQDLLINQIDIKIIYEKGQANENYTCTINVDAPKAGMTYTEKGEDAAKVTRSAVEKVIMEIHGKNKQIHSHK